MSSRKIVFTEGEYYHVYNRGVDHRSVTDDPFDSNRFVQCLDVFNDTELTGSLYALSFDSERKRGKMLVDVVAYCLNPNHFHLVLKQKVKNGISRFMHRLSGGYSYHYNDKHHRSGSLWQGKFKAKHIKENSYLLHCVTYVNLNDKVHQLRGKATKLVRTSWDQYALGNPGLCSKQIILGQFKNPNEYVKFAENAFVGMLEKRPQYEELKEILTED